MRLLRTVQRAFHNASNQTLRHLALALAALLAHGHIAHAAQFVEVRDGNTEIAQVSIKDQTRVALSGGKILEVLGDVFDKDKNPAGRFSVFPDAQAGEVYVRPRFDGTMYRPATLTFKTDAGKFDLLLQPLDMPADPIIMRNMGKAQPKGKQAQLISAATDPVRATPPEFNSPSYLRTIKGWMLAMATNQAPESLDVRQLHQDIKLWKDVIFTLDDEWVGRTLVGDRFTLKNNSANPLVLDEREFYKPGVLAVTVQKHQVDPGTETAIWILRNKTDRD